MSFAEGERFEILDTSHIDYWYARSLKTNKKGYIPRSYIEHEKTYGQEEWYEDIEFREVTEANKSWEIKRSYGKPKIVGGREIKRNYRKNHKVN